MIKGLNHVGISVANLDAAIAFYRDVIGMTLVVAPTSFSGPMYEAILALPGVQGRVALLKRDSLALELFEFAAPTPRAADPDRPVCDRGITHVCMEVADIEAEYRRLSAAGMRFHCAPLHFRGIAKATYGRDPDGNVLELLELGDSV